MADIPAMTLENWFRALPPQRGLSPTLRFWGQPLIRAAAIGWGLFLGAMLVAVCRHYGWDTPTVGMLAMPVFFVLQGLVERRLRRRFQLELGDA